MDKSILDPACGGKMFYYDKSDDRVLFCDIRNLSTELCDGRVFSVTPDMNIDFTNMPFQDNCFNLVIFDPPHLIRYSRNQTTGYQQIKYGSLTRNWRETLTLGLKECFRVLKPGGVLIFKWNETNIKASKILELTTYKPVIWNKSGKASETHWIVFMKEHPDDAASMRYGGNGND